LSLPKHMPALDGMRGVAIMMVIVTHAFGGWHGAFSIYQDTLAWPPTFTLPQWIFDLCDFCKHGVQLFFVVSAFTLWFRAPQTFDGILTYAVRRIARVGPGYWLAGLGYTLLAGAAPRLWAPNGVGISDLILAAIFDSAWQGGPSMAIVPGGWSVSCEVSFYLALPLLAWIIGGRVWRAVLLTALVTILAQVSAHRDMLAGHWDMFSIVHPVEEAPVFLCGIAGACIASKVRLPRCRGLVVALMALAAIGIPLGRQPQPWILLPHVAFAGIMALAVMFAASRPPRFLANAAMRKIGEVSYSMYLVHFVLLAPSLWLAQRLISTNDWRTLAVHIAVTFAVTFAVACVTWRIIERPAIKWAAARGHASVSRPAPIG
jgi:peptidoglycan/LPS O-acetylase OafA/YrhL